MPDDFGSEPIFFCRNAEQFGDGSPVYLLPTKRPTWWINAELPWMPRADLENLLQDSFDAWSQVADVKATRAASAQVAHLLVTVATIDGPAGVLADCMLPSPGLRQQIMRIDIAEQALKHLLGTILRHELGHFFALQHFPSGPPPELMEPILNQAVNGPQPTEAALMAKWYGQPVTPPPLPQPPGVLVCTMRAMPGTDKFACEITAEQGSRKATLTGSKPW